ncbi:acyl-CoA N-acyltransferase [Pyrenochaeta sp. MPI-SDFR-AT-0127]|nr:acyl-CoA N-acyltransferase [Pyrenochaeta sp. MPI-SDFR-AT-0127]
MAQTLVSAFEQHRTVSWPLRSFAVDKDSRSTSPADLFLDRVNGEFGFIRYNSRAVATIVQFPDTAEPIYFQAKGARAAAWRAKARKISVLFQHLQIDLEFISPEQARSFLCLLEEFAMAAGNHFFYSHEVPTDRAFMRADFDMIKHGFTGRAGQPWMAVPVDSSEWPRIRKTGDWSDFTIIAEGRKFSVHRVKICKESFYFKAVCGGSFAESDMQCIELPELAQTIDAMLDEMYGAYNETTGSLFTNFALRQGMEKERIMNQLLALFITSDKYSLEKVKHKAVEAIIDRLPFLNDALVLVDLAATIYDEQCPEHDRGLRKAITAHIQARMPDIIDDECAWQEFSDNKILLKAFHTYQCEVPESESSAGIITPPNTPNIKRGDERRRGKLPREILRADYAQTCRLQRLGHCSHHTWTSYVLKTIRRKNISCNVLNSHATNIEAMPTSTRATASRTSELTCKPQHVTAFARLCARLAAPMALDVTMVNGSPAIPATPALKSPQKPSVVPNVLEVVFGSLLIKPWYPSFYPEELVGRKVERLFVCQWCFKYSNKLNPFLGHLKACPLRDSPPPGVNVYAKDGYSLYEIDGSEHKLYAQNLSLFAKLFLDTKSVFYDVTTFLYYLLVSHNPVPGIPHTNLSSGEEGEGWVGEHGQVVGFFSKEKMSWDNNNLACILVLPPWQKQGLGQILMGASYEMSRREGRLGGPEKPLSDLGRLAYMHYWSATLARTILTCPSKKTLTVLDLREMTYIVPEDIIATLQAMEVLDHKKRGGADAVINKAKVRAWAENHKVNLKSWPVDPDAFVVREASRNGSEES